MQKNNSYFMHTAKSRADVERLLSHLRAGRNEFFALNGKDIDAISEGELVKIPYRLSGCVRGRFYMLQRRDTLYAIAQRRRIKVSHLLDENPLFNPGRAVAGQMIVLPESLEAPEPGCTEYTVENRDTLYDILRKFDLSVRELQEENAELDIFALKPGQILLIRKKPAKPKKTYVLQEDENLHTLPQRFGHNIVSILRANPQLRPLDFKGGVNIVLPE